MRAFIITIIAAAIAIGGLAGAGQAPDVPTRPQAWNKLTPEERAELKKRREQFRQLSPEKQQRLRERFQQYMKLSPEQQEKLRERWQVFKQLTPEQKQQMMARHRHWQQLSEESRQRVRQHLQERFMRMNDAQLGDFFRKLNVWRTLSDEEQNELYQRFMQLRHQRRNEAREQRGRFREP